MKIKCYDKYNKQWLIIKPENDHLNLDIFNSKYAKGSVRLEFKCADNKGEDPSPERWSDLEKFEIVKKRS